MTPSTASEDRFSDLPVAVIVKRGRPAWPTLYRVIEKEGDAESDKGNAQIGGHGQGFDDNEAHGLMLARRRWKRGSP
jgi:hypothetical protein